jgi:hypothetical protein
VSNGEDAAGDEFAVIPAVRSGVIVVLDYTGRRTEAPISALDLESAGFELDYLLVPPYPRAFTASDYAAELLREYRIEPDEIAAVLAYCMAAPIAQELLAQVVGEGGEPIPLVLFDGEPVTAAAVRSEYVLAGRKLGELLGLTAAQSVPEGDFDAEALRREPRDAVERMHNGLAEMGVRAAVLDGSDPEEARADAAAVADFYIDWLAHLVAAYNTGWPHWGGPVYQLVSVHQQALMPWPGAQESYAARIAAERDVLLTDPGTRRLVVQLLSGGQ